MDTPALFWFNPAGRECRLVVLEADRIYVAAPPVDTHDAIRMALEEGEETAPALGDEYIARIRIETIEAATHIEGSPNELRLMWQEQGKTRTTALEFATTGDRGAFQDALANRLRS